MDTKKTASPLKRRANAVQVEQGSEGPRVRIATPYGELSHVRHADRAWLTLDGQPVCARVARQTRRAMQWAIRSTTVRRRLGQPRQQWPTLTALHAAMTGHQGLVLATIQSGGLSESAQLAYETWALRDSHEWKLSRHEQAFVQQMWPEISSTTLTRRFGSLPARLSPGARRPLRGAQAAERWLCAPAPRRGHRVKVSLSGPARQAMGKASSEIRGLRALSLLMSEAGLDPHTRGQVLSAAVLNAGYHSQSIEWDWQGEHHLPQPEQPSWELEARYLYRGQHGAHIETMPSGSQRRALATLIRLSRTAELASLLGRPQQHSDVVWSTETITYLAHKIQQMTSHSLAPRPLSSVISRSGRLKGGRSLDLIAHQLAGILAHIEERLEPWDARPMAMVKWLPSQWPEMNMIGDQHAGAWLIKNKLDQPWAPRGQNPFEGQVRDESGQWCACQLLREAGELRRLKCLLGSDAGNTFHSRVPVIAVQRGNELYGATLMRGHLFNPSGTGGQAAPAEVRRAVERLIEAWHRAPHGPAAGLSPSELSAAGLNFEVQPQISELSRAAFERQRETPLDWKHHAGLNLFVQRAQAGELALLQQSLKVADYIPAQYGAITLEASSTGAQLKLPELQGQNGSGARGTDVLNIPVWYRLGPSAELWQGEPSTEYQEASGAAPRQVRRVAWHLTSLNGRLHLDSRVNIWRAHPQGVSAHSCTAGRWSHRVIRHAELSEELASAYEGSLTPEAARWLGLSSE